MKYATERPIDLAIARIAECQHGVISLEQLRILGLSPPAVRARVARGRLHRVHRGVYAVGHANLTQHGRWMAAVLACGDGAVLSHLSAAHLIGLSLWSGSIEVAAPARRGRRRPGIIVHPTQTLHPRNLCQAHGIPSTNWARIVLDLAGTRPRQVAAKALERAETLRVFDLGELEDVMSAAGSHAGVRMLRDLLSGYREGLGETESPAEEAFLEICARTGISRPLCNFWMEIAGRWIRHDFWWPRERVSVEVDGFGTHGTRGGFRADRRRDRNLLLNSDIALLRFDAWEINHAGDEVARDVKTLLRKLALAPSPGDG
ncbi:MAG: type IV toxin-antitoxin system AbiEi family antitoxin domain-containing protein [Actinomycetota bacterium]|nr:type IV toxin-antitoxin system AbiEi family antitoxin domain-containing protein [Actinomycetota bacterium]